MGTTRARDRVAGLALVAAGALGAFLLLRSRGTLGAHWTDGRRSFDSEVEVGVRHAVWDRPETFESLGEARDPSLSPDGRWLVFVSGERGLNAELYVAELVDGAPRAPRRLVELDSPADELAPAFGTGELFFASDRSGGAGGLDLWRAPFAEGVFGAPEPLGPGLNSRADETDPAPVPGTQTLIFASDRARPDLDLYLASREADGRLHVDPLEGLNGPANECEPAVAPDGRSMWFASDRDGALALFRAPRAGTGWRAPERAPDLPAARGPWPAADGFTLWLEQADAPGEPRLARARSLELFRRPAAPVGWLEWLTLAGLFVVALLALLARRWKALDVLYKCALVSLILHLLLMLYLRTVVPEERVYETGRDQERSFRVQLAPDEAAGGLEAHLGPAAPVEPRPAPPLASVQPVARPAAAALEVSSVDAPAPPAPAPLERASAPVPEARLRTEGALLERHDAAAPELALAAHAIPCAAPALPGPSAPTAPAPARTLARPAAATPELAALPAARATAGDDASGPLPREEHTRIPSGGADPALAMPVERFARAERSAPALVLEARATPSRAPSTTTDPQRAPEIEASASDSATFLPRAVPRAVTLGTPIAAEPAVAVPAPTRAALEAAAPPFAEPEASRTLRTLASEPTIASDSSPAFEAVVGLEPRPAPPLALGTADAVPRPERPAPGPQAPRAAPVVGLPADGSREARTLQAPAAPAPRPLLAESSSPARPAELRAPTAEAGAPSAVTSPRFDAAAGLEGLPPASAAKPPQSPARAPLAAPLERPPLRPAPAALALPDSAVGPEIAAPERASETPYQNRFGPQKLRSLEEFGGTRETEHAVEAGLAYLARIQNRDGSWGQRTDAHAKYLDVRIGKSALSLLAFLGAGHVPGGGGAYSENAARAVEFLLSAQDAASGHLGRSCSYGHGIATYALAECHALTHDARLAGPLQAAVSEILRHQDRRRDRRVFGGWGYYFADDHVWNGDDWPRTSVTAWQVMALESARLGGLTVPDEAFAAAREFLGNAWDARAGAFRYDHDPERLASGYPILPASTPAALFALSLLDVDPAQEDLAPARRFVLARLPDGYRYTGDDDFVRRARGNVYFWYYSTLALFRVGGKAWESWNAALKETLLPAQAEDGSWEPIDTYADYAGDDDAERTYTTAMCVLSLEIYYRYFTPLLRVR